MLRRRDFLAALPAPLLVGSVRESPKSVILLLLVGGPSQIDTWDPKPNAPSNIRSPWKSIRTNVPGMEITELFPRMARQADKFTLVRSVHHDGPALHDVGHQILQTGFHSMNQSEFAHIGCLSGNHVVLPHTLGNTGSGEVPNGQNGLQPLTDFNLQSEPPKLRAQYGNTKFGRSCLMARKLVEQGTPFVTVNMYETVFGQPTWDAHGSEPFSPLSSHRDHAAPSFDMAYSALLQDLSSRGMLQNTLVVATGEFGRTPRINPVGGRDHWANCWTAILAGGTTPAGTVYGTSDATASEPKDNPVHANRIAASMANHLGISLPGIAPL